MIFFKLLSKLKLVSEANDNNTSDPTSDSKIFTLLAALLAKGRRLRAKSQVKEPVSAIVVRFNAVDKNKRSEFFDCKSITELETDTQSIQKTTITWTLGKRNARRVPSVERWEEKASQQHLHQTLTPRRWVASALRSSNDWCRRS